MTSSSHPHAASLAELGGLCFWIALVVLALIVIAAVWAFARGSQGAESVGHVLDADMERRLTQAVAASTLVSLVLLAVLVVAAAWPPAAH